MNKIQLHNGDCFDVLKTIADNSIDTIITDPPYGLSNHETDEVVACIFAWIQGQEYSPKTKGFMGKTWDAWVPSPQIWKECFRVLKPGGMCLVFAGTRSMDLMGLALRLAGFEFRDSIGYLHDSASMMAWVHGQGFPKSLAIDKAIDKAAGATREIIGIKQRGSVEDAKERGIGYLADPANKNNTKQFGYGTEEITAPATDAAKEWQGWGTALKPAFEPILLCMKPCEGTFAENALKHGVAGLNIDGGRVGTEIITQTRTAQKTWREREGRNDIPASADNSITHTQGRWPANIIHDGSEMVVKEFPDNVKGGTWNRTGGARPFNNNGEFTEYVTAGSDKSCGSASRFFYCAKASKSERNAGCEQNNHPTVKPLTLLKYLCTLTKTPTGGTVLDPFMGSGTTGVACRLVGRDFIGIEREAEYLDIAEARIKHASQGGVAAEDTPMESVEPPALICQDIDLFE